MSADDWCRHGHVASSAAGVPDLPHLAAHQRLLPSGSVGGPIMALEPTSHAHFAVGLQLWRCHDVDALVVPMAFTATDAAKWAQR